MAEPTYRPRVSNHQVDGTAFIKNLQIQSGGSVDFSNASLEPVSKKIVTLASADILALHTTPKSLIAAPGSGKYIVIERIVAKNVFNANAYTGANAIEIRYTDGSGVKLTGDLASAFIDISSGTRVDVAIGSAIAIAVANAAVVAAVPSADPAAGDGVITLTIYYRTVTA